MSSTSTIAFLLVPSPYQPYSVSQRSYNGQTLSFTRSSLIINHIPLSSTSSSSSSVVVEEEEESPSPSPDGLATQDPDNAFPPTSKKNTRPKEIQEVTFCQKLLVTSSSIQITRNQLLSWNVEYMLQLPGIRKETCFPSAFPPNLSRKI
ncbi:uncharacterized protein LOC114264773 [Camellia sinensis]|uniref:uncharacterized protein LOC114264773 n=1 Tax=Camellia sinensis TaxID=4442 RepID=UPI0010361EE6|nr:uncharacterized protein LOC114264773 [Camellia sinensis]